MFPGAERSLIDIRMRIGAFFPSPVHLKLLPLPRGVRAMGELCPVITITFLGKSRVTLPLVEKKQRHKEREKIAPPKTMVPSLHHKFDLPNVRTCNTLMPNPMYYLSTFIQDLSCLPQDSLVDHLDFSLEIF